MVALRPGRLLRTRFVTLIGRPIAGNVLHFNNAGNCLAAAPVLDALVHANGHYYTKSPRLSASSGQRRLNQSRSSRGSPARSRVLRAALRERFNKTAGGGRRVEKQHAGGFAAAVLPRMWEIARHERAGAGPAYGHLIADLQGHLAREHPGDLVVVAVQMEEACGTGGRASSNIMMLSPVSRPSSFNAKQRPVVAEAAPLLMGGAKTH